MPRACEALGSRRSTSAPSIRISPLVGGCTPAMILISVDLPAPLSPTSATISPAWISRLNSSIADDAAEALVDVCAATARSGGAVTAANPPAPAEGVMDGLDSRRAARQSRDAHDIGARDEGLRPEAEHDAVADACRRAAVLDHAVIVDRGAAPGFRPASAPSARPSARARRSPYRIVGKHRIDIEAAAEAEGLVADADARLR